MFQEKIQRFQNKYGLSLIEGQTANQSPQPIQSNKKVLNRGNPMKTLDPQSTVRDHSPTIGTIDLNEPSIMYDDGGN